MAKLGDLPPSSLRYKSVVPNEYPKYTSKDITIIIPTIYNDFLKLRSSLQSILGYEPAKLIIITIARRYHALEEITATLRLTDGTTIEVLYVDKANKRLQVCQALEGDHIQIVITVMADDNLGAAYIERRNFEISATHNIDRGTSYISRRTVFIIDPLLLLLYWRGTADWALNDRYTLLGAELAFIFCFTKFIKLAGLFYKNPRDIVFLPVSIIFSYFHGLIKLYTLFILK
ncbi:glycosyltransferase family 2 protein [Lasiosphaeria ovina]|uniref:Glycosyltransferase family 2 protein n=1 Tax=Lasiosphaeria ovina TaxID=92902 RepID=A0AAE0K3Z3_9PEZI|nr:glycosyltransferase family 2 protein [Lasiosphaeria ovina]